MTTLRIRALVSLAATLTATLALGGCASGASRSPDVEVAPVVSPTFLRFDNTGREFVRVYLVGQRREWLLGRVEPGAAAALRLPNGLMDEGAGFVQLAVVSGGQLTLRAASDPRARMTIAQPATALLNQRWRFAQDLAAAWGSEPGGWRLVGISLSS